VKKSTISMEHPDLIPKAGATVCSLWSPRKKHLWLVGVINRDAPAIFMKAGKRDEFREMFTDDAWKIAGLCRHEGH
jgi:hypothetical protein